MATNTERSQLRILLSGDTSALLEEWVAEQGRARSGDLMKTAELREQSAEFLRLMNGALQQDPSATGQGEAWEGVRAFLGDVSRSRARQGFTPSETATFIFSLKRPMFALLRQRHGQDAEGLFIDVWAATQLLDGFGLYTTEVQQKARDEVISRQQAEMLELSTPVVKLWDGIVALPLIGTLDSARTQVVMESLLQKIVEMSAPVAIIDITGVPTVDTLVAQHLLKTVTAARLMGAECIISGIRPQIAQTIVHLGVNLGDVVTKASLADAFQLALQRVGVALNRPKARS